MKVNYRSLFGATIIIGAIVCANAYHSAVIRGQYLAAQHFEIFATAVCAEARAQLAEKTGGVQAVNRTRWSETLGRGKAEVSDDWEIAPKDSVAGNLEMQAMAQAIRAKLQEIANTEQSALHYYYPNVQLGVEASVIDSKCFNKRAILISLKCNS